MWLGGKRECNQYIGIYTSKWAFFFQNDDSRRVNNYSKDAVSTRSHLWNWFEVATEDSLHALWECQLNCFTSCCAALPLQSCLTLCVPMDRSPQAPPPMEFSRQEYGGGLFKVIPDFKPVIICPSAFTIFVPNSYLPWFPFARTCIQILKDNLEGEFRKSMEQWWHHWDKYKP